MHILVQLEGIQAAAGVEVKDPVVEGYEDHEGSPAV
jgi:hypothetical protein